MLLLDVVVNNGRDVSRPYSGEICGEGIYTCRKKPDNKEIFVCGVVMPVLSLSEQITGTTDN